jgi:hypothetical protein
MFAACQKRKLSNTIFFCFFLQLTVIHPALPEDVQKVVSSKVDIQLAPKDSHRQIGVHAVEQPLFNLAAERESFIVGGGARDQSMTT